MMWRRCCPRRLPAASSRPWRGSGSPGSSSCSTSRLPWTAGAVSLFPLRAGRKGRCAVQQGFLKDRLPALGQGDGHETGIPLISREGCAPTAHAYHVHLLLAHTAIHSLSQPLASFLSFRGLSPSDLELCTSCIFIQEHPWGNKEWGALCPVTISPDLREGRLGPLLLGSSCTMLLPHPHATPRSQPTIRSASTPPAEQCPVPPPHHHSADSGFHLCPGCTSRWALPPPSLPA